MSEVRPHWLSVAGAAKTPEVTVSLSVATSHHPDGGGEVLRLAAWAALVRQRHMPAGVADVTHELSSASPATLASTIEAAASLTGSVWVFCLRLGVGLAVTSLPVVLLARGWRVRFLHLGSESSVLVVERDGERATITDAWSWLHTGTREAAHDVGMRDAPAGGRSTTPDLPEVRSMRRARILDRLLVDLLGWWDTSEVGSFAATASACGWRTLRARIRPRSVLVGPERPRTALERAAIHGGRKEVYRVGVTSGCWVDDWDIVAAHLTVMAHMPLPAAPVRERYRHALADPLHPPDGVGSVVRVRVTTTTPCAPVTIGGEVFWPVGSFTTTLTSAELPYVLEVAATVEVLDSELYEMSGWAGRWGRWCKDLMAGAPTNTPRVVRRVAKGWGRSVPGRFAMLSSRLLHERPASTEGWGVQSGMDLSSGHRLEVLTIGGVERTMIADVDHPDCSPVVLAFVEGYVRALVGRLVAARPAGSVLQVNTDGWWERRPPRSVPPPDEELPLPWQLARKMGVRRVEILGPSHTITERRRRLSGVPRTATPTGEHQWGWHDEPGLRWQMEHGAPGEYRRPRRGVKLAEHYCRRWVLQDGTTRAPSSTIAEDGTTLLCPWSSTAERQAGDRLADHQTPLLAALRDA